ncbi:hypothetical protein RMATCC62417_02747 [Rhizopus microsporus]|nr:hypothetical protein RMATCC62417_02747 [Rhizopus microsporus]
MSDSYHMSFTAGDHHYLHKLIDDLTIIDDLYSTFESESESSSYEKQVLDASRHVVHKQQTLDRMIQSETSYLNRLSIFQDTFVRALKIWLNNTEKKEATRKIKGTSLIEAMDSLERNLGNLLDTHSNFLKQIKERYSIWGPTQLVSDIFSELFVKLPAAHTSFVEHYVDYLIAFDTLFRTSLFSKFMQINKNDVAQLQKNIEEIVHYLEMPLSRSLVYEKALQQLKHHSDPKHPDYTSIAKIAEKFKGFEAEWEERRTDCLSRLAVLQTCFTIQGCPITVTRRKRLLLSNAFIHVDVDDPSSTTDIRIYYLYNDQLIHCKKQKEKKDQPTTTVYKGTIILKDSDVQPLQSTIIEKIKKGKKPLFKIGKRSNDPAVPVADSEIFGFEIVAREYIKPLEQTYFGSLPVDVIPVLRRYVIRVHSLEEQNLWYETIRKAINLSK